MSLTATEPVETYTFIGGFKTYRYTSADTKVFIDGDEFEPIPIKRGAVRAGDQSQDQLEVEVCIPYDIQVVLDYAYLTSPPTLELVITAFDRPLGASTNNFSNDTGAILWSGEVAGFSVSGRLAKIRIPSNFAKALQNNIPSIYYQNPCNHVLYDSRCGVSRVAFTNAGVNVVSVENNLIRVVGDGFDNNFLNAGEIINTRTSERRLIISNIDDLITVNLAFVDLLVGDSVDLVAGCDHSFTTCQNKFTNGPRYGAFPFIPLTNPFEGRI